MKLLITLTMLLGMNSAFAGELIYNCPTEDGLYGLIITEDETVGSIERQVHALMGQDDSVTIPVQTEFALVQEPNGMLYTLEDGEYILEIVDDSSFSNAVFYDLKNDLLLTDCSLEEEVEF